MSAIVSGKLIQGVDIIDVKQVKGDHGIVMPWLQSENFNFADLGEAYFSVLNPGAIQGWRKHKLGHQNLAVCSGLIKLVIYDDRPSSPTHGQTQEIVTGRDHFALIHIPPRVWYGHLGLSKEPVVIGNCATLKSTPGEVMQLPLDNQTIPYRWNKRAKISE